MIAQPNKAPNSAEDHDGRRMPPTISADPRGGRPSGIFIFCVANRESYSRARRRGALRRAWRSCLSLGWFWPRKEDVGLTH